MALLIWLALFLLVVLFLVVAGWVARRAIYERYSGARPVTCPENHKPAVVSIDVEHAAATVMDGTPALRLCDCTRWPERAVCNQDCISHAARAEPYLECEPTGKKQIYHLPVLLAAFAAWYMGMLWHSHYLFRSKWIDAAGLTQAQVKEFVWWLSPQLLSAAVCLLFAYGVAWLVAVLHRKGALQGVAIAAALTGTVLMATWFGIARLPSGLLTIEGGYVLLATVMVGAIVGGLWDKLTLPAR